MKKLLLAMLLVVTVLLGGCFGDKTEEKASNESILAALQQLGQTTKKADSANGVKAGAYFNVSGEYYFYSFEDITLMSAAEQVTFFSYWGSADASTSFIINDDKAITLAQTNEAVMAGNSLATVLVSNGADVDGTLAILPSTVATNGLTGAQAQADGQDAGELNIAIVSDVANGTITLEMSKTTGVSTVVAGNFTVMKTVTTPGSATVAAVTATGVVVASTSEKQVVLTVPAETASYDDVQTINYTVAYLTNAAVAAPAVTLDKKPGTEPLKVTVSVDQIVVEFATGAIEGEAIEWTVATTTAITVDEVIVNDRFYTLKLAQNLAGTGSVTVGGTIGSAGNYVDADAVPYNFSGTGTYVLEMEIKNYQTKVNPDTDDVEPAVEGGGANTLQVQAYFVDAGSRTINTEVEGELFFTLIGDGQISQDKVTMDDGIATVLVRPEAVTVDTLAKIQVQVSGIAGPDPNNLKLADSINKNIWFLAPEQGDSNTASYRTYGIQSADAYQADRLFVTFKTPLLNCDASGTPKADDYIDFESIFNISAAGGDGLIVKEAYPTDKAVGDVVDILDVVRTGEATYLLILDTDEKDNASFLKDNSGYIVEIPADINKKDSNNYIIEKGSTFFRFTDINTVSFLSAEMVKNSNGSDSATQFKLYFDEAVAYNWNAGGNNATTMNPEVGSAGGKKWFASTISNIVLDGTALNLTANNNFEVAAVAVGNWDIANAPSAKTLADAATIDALDNRDTITVTLTDKAAQYQFLADGVTHTKQVSIAGGTIGDWAGIYDANNRMTVEEKPLTYKIEKAAIAIEKIIVDSPEQILVKFQDPVRLNTAEALQDVLQMYYGVDSLAPITDDTDGTEYLMNKADVKITVLDAEDGEDTLFDVTNPGEAGSFQYVLFELNKTWDEILGGVSYSNNQFKTVQFRVGAEKLKLLTQFWPNENQINSNHVVLMRDLKSPHIRHTDNVVDTLGYLNDYYGEKDEPTEEDLNTYVVQKSTEGGTVGVVDGYDATYDNQDVIIFTMNEPVQVEYLDDGVTALTDPTTHTADEITTKITFETILNGSLVTVYGQYQIINERDMRIIATPNFGDARNVGAASGAASLKDIKVGTWTVVITNIRDDLKNNMDTVYKDIEIKGDGPVIIEDVDGIETGTYVAWARYIDNNDNNYFTNNTLLDGKDLAQISVIEVKYSTVMKSAIPEGADQSANYFVNGVALPAEAQVIKGIYGVTDQYDGVTIVMENAGAAIDWLDANEDGAINEYIQMSFSREMRSVLKNEALGNTEIDLRTELDPIDGVTDTDEITDDLVAEWVCNKLRSNSAGTAHNNRDDNGLASLQNNYVAYRTTDLDDLDEVLRFTNGYVSGIELPTYDFVELGSIDGVGNANKYAIELHKKSGNQADGAEMVDQAKGAQLTTGVTASGTAEVVGNDGVLVIANAEDHFDLTGTNTRIRVFYDDCMIYNLDMDDFYGAEVVRTEALDTNADGEIETFKVYSNSNLDGTSIGDNDFTINAAGVTSGNGTVTVSGSVATIVVASNHGGMATNTAVAADRDITLAGDGIKDYDGRALDLDIAGIGTPLDLASPVLIGLGLSDNAGDNDNTDYDVAGEILGLVFSEAVVVDASLRGIADADRKAELESAIRFAGTATDGNNFGDAAAGGECVSAYATTTVANDTLAVTLAEAPTNALAAGATVSLGNVDTDAIEDAAGNDAKSNGVAAPVIVLDID
jgi:hypothetical protein